VPSRSDIEGWDTSYLDDADIRWRAAAEASESGFEQHLRNVSAPGGTTWRGEAADAAVDRAFLDLTVVRRHGEVQMAAAGIARRGSEDIQSARNQVLDAVADAEDDGFRVGEDLSVTDTRVTDWASRAARMTAATEHAEYIRWRAGQLVATDALVGQQLQAKAAELEGIRFEGEVGGNQGDPTIRLVDNKTEKEPSERSENAQARARTKSWQDMLTPLEAGDAAETAAESPLEALLGEDKVTAAGETARESGRGNVGGGGATRCRATHGGRAHAQSARGHRQKRRPSLYAASVGGSHSRGGPVCDGSTTCPRRCRAPGSSVSAGCLGPRRWRSR